MKAYEYRKYRIYPSPEQVKRMTGWAQSLRWLWNLANEQRLMGLNRTDVRHVLAFDQIYELPALRKACPWLQDVPSSAAQYVLMELDRAWQRCFLKMTERPRWKRKYDGFSTICAPGPKMWLIKDGTLRFPKIGTMPIRVHRPLVGLPKTCMIIQEVDQWFACISCEVEKNTTSHPIPHSQIAMDFGVVNIVADSDGNIIKNQTFGKKLARKLARLQRKWRKKAKGGKNRKKLVIKANKVHRKIRRQRHAFLHKISNDYAKSHGTIITERLNILAMTKSGSGSVTKPGVNVKQKRGLNFAIADAGWGVLGEMLEYKAAREGGRVLKVQAAYSSQTCSACGHVGATSRRSQSVFVCVKCGHQDHADVNAAKVLKIRAVESAVQVCGGHSDVTRPKKQKLRVAKHRTRKSGDDYVTTSVPLH